MTRQDYRLMCVSRVTDRLKYVCARMYVCVHVHSWCWTVSERIGECVDRIRLLLKEETCV